MLSQAFFSSVVPPGVDRAVYSEGEEERDASLIVWIGRLEPYKRAGDLLEALPEVIPFGSGSPGGDHRFRVGPPGS